MSESVRDAQVLVGLLGSRVVQPALPAAPRTELHTDQEFNQVIRDRVLGDPVTRVRITDDTGTVLYASDAEMVGQRIPLTAAEVTAVASGTTTAHREDGSDPTSLRSGRADQALDVSAGLRTASGQAVLLQTRQPYGVVWLTSRGIWLTTVPSLIIALAVLYLIKAAFAVRLARRLSGSQEERERHLLTTLAATDRQRTLIASDLHDGVVQGLTGAGYTLSDAAKRSRAAGQTEVADTLTATSTNLRQWVRELRSLIVTVTPPALHSEGLQAALTDLVATLEARSIAVDLDVSVADDLPESAESLVYRAAQESVRNIVRHANPTRVELTVRQTADTVALEVSDDGDGFDPASVDRGRGSVGLSLLAALVQQQGGVLRVASGQGEGTTLTLELPLRDHASRAVLS